MLIIDPSPRSVIARAKTIVGRIVPKRFRSTTLRTASGSRSKKVLSGGIVAPGILPPAAFMSTSIRPKRSMISAWFSASDARSRTSVAYAAARPPSAATSAASRSPASRLRSKTTTCAPCSAKWRTMADPRIPAAPVMTMTRSPTLKRFLISDGFLNFPITERSFPPAAPDHPENKAAFAGDPHPVPRLKPRGGK